MPVSKTVARREALINAAAAEFDEHGYAAASLSSIAGRLGRTKGSINYYYPSKTSLAAAVVETQYSQWDAVLASVRAEGYTGIDALIVVAFIVAARFRDDVLVRAAIRLQADPGLHGGELPTPFVGWIGITAGLLAEAQSLGQVRTALAPEAAAEVLVEAFTGAQEISNRLTGTRDLESRVRGYWMLSLPGLGIEDGAERVTRLATEAERINAPGSVPAGSVS